MSDEEKLREELARQEEIAEKKAMTPKTNPLGEEHLRRITEYKPETEDEQEKRQKQNIKEELFNRQKQNNGHPERPIDSGNQGGLQWRKRLQDHARKYFAEGASYEWVLWKMMRESGSVIETARRIIEDAIREEPMKKEPEGRPNKKG